MSGRVGFWMQWLGSTYDDFWEALRNDKELFARFYDDHIYITPDNGTPLEVDVSGRVLMYYDPNTWVINAVVEA